MKLAAAEETHLTYGTDVHPAETLEDVYKYLGTFVLAVKLRVSPEKPYGVGLRLSATAAEELASPRALGEFVDFLASRGLYVFTLDGTIYAGPVGPCGAERSLRPDWLEPKRLDYADRLAVILAALLPAGVEGTVSTAAGAGKERARSAADEEKLAQRLLGHAATLDAIANATGKNVCLALEPEAGALLDTAERAVAFFQKRLFSRAAVAGFAKRTRKTAARAEESLHKHLGICLDAGQLDRPGDALKAFDRAGVRVAKFRFSPPFPGCPVDAQKAVESLLELVARRPGPRHLEVEGFNWRLQPEEHQKLGLVHALATELEWTARAVSGARHA